VKPPIPYYGGKQTIAERIVRLLPAHKHYVEPFCGSLSVLLAKPPAAHETVNDLDGALMTFWRVLRDRPSDLERVAALTPHSRAEHEQANVRLDDLDDGLDEVEIARLVWVQLTQGRGGTRRPTGWRFYRAPAGSTSMPRYLRGYVDRMPPGARRLLGTSLECRPALDVIRDYGVEPDVLLYVDPPYLATTRSSRQYKVEMSRPEEHAELIEALRECRAAVVLSGYESPLYDDLCRGWERTDLCAFTGQAGNAQDRTEVLWSNRPLAGPDLFDDLASEVRA
jgi:DNA adenine methylase